MKKSNIGVFFVYILFLDLKSPKIDTNEESLSRNSRSLLSELRSGYSRKFNSYLHRINDKIEDKCPQCIYGKIQTWPLATWIWMKELPKCNKPDVQSSKDRLYKQTNQR